MGTFLWDSETNKQIPITTNVTLFSTTDDKSSNGIAMNLLLFNND